MGELALEDAVGLLYDGLQKEWPVIKYYPGEQMKCNEMGGTCGTYGGEERCIQGFGGKI